MAAKLLLLAAVVGTPAVALLVRQTEPDDLVSTANAIHDLANDLAGSSANLLHHSSLAAADADGDFAAFGAFGASKAQKASTVAAVFEAFRKGKFKGGACKKNAASLFTEDAVIDNRAGPREKNYFKKYSPGVAGLCEYFGKAYRFTLHGLKTTQYARGKEIVQVLHYRPSIGTTKAKETMTQWNVIRFNADGTKFAGLEVIMDKNNLYNTLTMDIELAKTTKQMKLVQKMRVLFDKGKFKKRVAYGRCLEYVQKYFTKDAVIDFRGGGTKDVKYFRKYPAGEQGVCNWYAKEYSHTKSELKIEMFPRGYENDVMLRLSYRPKGLFDGPITKHTVLQQMLFKFNKDGTQVRGIDNYFDRQDVWDEFYTENSGRPHDRPSTVAAVFNAFGLGKFKGGLCKKEVKKLFTKDAVIDNTGPKDESFFMKHKVGFDGVCEYFNMAYTSGYGMKNLNSTVYARGKDMVQVLKYQPIKGLKRGTGTVTQFNVFRFSKFGRKMAGFDALIDKPVLYDKLLFWNAPPSGAPAMAPAPATAPGPAGAPAPGPAGAPAPAALYLPRYPVTKRIEVFQQVRHAFAKKQFKHRKACVKATAKFFTADAVIDFRGGGTIKVNYFRKYPAGLEGVCEWYQEEYHHLLKDLTIDMYQRGDDVLVRQRYRPQVLHHGPSTRDFVIHEMLVKYNKEGTKITGMEHFFDRTDVWDEMVELDLYGKRLEAPCAKVKCGALGCPAPFKLKMDKTCCGYCWAPDSKVALDRHRAGRSMGFAIKQCERAPSYCRGPGPTQVQCFKTSCVAGEKLGCPDDSCCPRCTGR